ncbi:hypothetical protein EVAR_922_1 [Eumeta japonica]|uniref:Uncharacterized protein n=1 Tax=Eumeta variegata TaxID=151549 RepID=A0A4C1SG43_EUMVA|nr:hypothetical protein EVAR_922_1 [Eumeta japonica]
MAAVRSHIDNSGKKTLKSFEQNIKLKKEDEKVLLEPSKTCDVLNNHWVHTISDISGACAGPRGVGGPDQLVCGARPALPSAPSRVCGYPNTVLHQWRTLSVPRRTKTGRGPLTTVIPDEMTASHADGLPLLRSKGRVV